MKFLNHLDRFHSSPFDFYHRLAITDENRSRRPHEQAKLAPAITLFFCYFTCPTRTTRFRFNLNHTRPRPAIRWKLQNQLILLIIHQPYQPRSKPIGQLILKIQQNSPKHKDPQFRKPTFYVSLTCTKRVPRSAKNHLHSVVRADSSLLTMNRKYSFIITINISAACTQQYRCLIVKARRDNVPKRRRTYAQTSTAPSGQRLSPICSGGQCKTLFHINSLIPYLPLNLISYLDVHPACHFKKLNLIYSLSVH